MLSREEEAVLLQVEQADRTCFIAWTTKRNCRSPPIMVTVLKKRTPCTSYSLFFIFLPDQRESILCSSTLPHPTA